MRYLLYILLISLAMYADEVPVVQSLVIEGVEASHLKAKLETKEGQFFSQETFDHDLKMLSKDFIVLSPEIESTEKGVKITLVLKRKPKVENIFFEGNHLFSTSDLLEASGLTSGVIFDRAMAQQAVNRLYAFFLKKGFFDADISFTTKEVGEHEVDLILHIHEGRAGRIAAVRFEGFTQEEVDKLSRELYHRPYRPFISWFTSEGYFHNEAIKQDLLTATSFLQNEGFEDGFVTYRIEDAPEKGRVVLYLTAHKGPLYHVGVITISGNEHFPLEVIEKLLCIHHGDPYSPLKIQESVQEISKLYGRKGYIDTYVNYTSSLDPENHLFNIHFSIEEGASYRVGIIKVFGNSNTQTRVILHETLLTPGETFNQEKLKKTEERLKNIGYFSHVNVYAVKPQSEVEGADFRDIHIEVEEMSTGKIGGFGAYSTTEGGTGGFTISQSNFNYRGLPHLFSEGLSAIRGGGEYLHFATSIGQSSRTIILSWTKPFFYDTRWTVGFDIERASTRYVAREFNVETFGGNIHADYQLNAFMRTAVHYRLKHTHLIIGGDDISEKWREEADNSGTISAIGNSLIYDSTNDPLRPSEGIKSRLEGEIAGVGGDRQFFGIAYLNSIYHPLGNSGVMLFRADFRFLQPLFHTQSNHLPYDERLFLGGAETIRGFRPYRLGPHYETVKGKGEREPKGGLSLQFFSLEYTHPIIEKISSLVFLDAGQLSDKTWNFGRLYLSMGYGIQIYVFDRAPPLIVGMGYPLNAHSRKDIKRFFFSIGGKF